MRNSGVRWLFVLACVLALAAVAQDFRFDSSSRQQQIATRDIEREVGDLRVTLADLRGGQAAYLATGQGTEFWTRRVADLATRVESGISRLRSLVQSAEAQSALGVASTALADLMAADARARRAIESEQRFLAADIVFAEARDATQSLADAVTSAGTAEIATLDARMLRDSRFRLALMPVALLVVIVAGALALGQSPRQPAPASAAATMAQMLRELPPPVKAPGVPAQPVRPPTPAAASPVLDLGAAAELCVDLARVMDARDMPTLVERAAKTLDASGVVVWVITRHGDRLMPVLTHGYSQKVITKLGALDTAADNMTSVCYRTMRPQSMPGVGQPGATSAIAVPLVTTEGCNGVIAAELAIAKPPAETVALARIIAAQFATMLSPVDAETGGIRAAEA